MSGRRAFYVLQGYLEVHESMPTGDAAPRRFSDDERGHRDFETYLASTPLQDSVVVVDVIEEMFAVDTVPDLGARDRASLLKRRAERKYPRTPYRLSVLARRKRGAPRQVVYGAIANPDLLSPWISLMLRQRVPVAGIYSVPLMAPKILARFYKSSSTVLFITQHQGNRLRQVFVEDGVVKSARLTQSPDIDDPDYPRAVSTEIQRSRRYLERTRLLSPMQQLDICMVAPRELSGRIYDCAESDSPMRLHFVDPERAAGRVGLTGFSTPDHAERLFIGSAMRSRPRWSYARSGENRFWQMSRMRRGIIATAGLSAAVCSIVAGFYLGDAWRLHRESAFIETQVLQLTETFRRESESFGPLKADSYSMKLAVDTGDFILDQRVPVPWVMNQLGGVLNDYRDVRILELSWRAETEAPVQAIRPRPGEPPPPVAIPPVRAVTVELSASLNSYGGDLRGTFERIDALVEDIASRTSFIEARAIEYPLDASTRASITGEIRSDDGPQQATFRLLLKYPLTDDGADDAV